ncbi:hypothetical protein [Thermococcus sp.]|uniref:hypothetical protein n=1 Tax=Thermococcus sp. TaxID=35749 RepID=UPI0026229B32|nr:hypothetical protein [Thermococcus sp.]
MPRSSSGSRHGQSTEYSSGFPGSSILRDKPFPVLATSNGTEHPFRTILPLMVISRAIGILEKKVSKTGGLKPDVKGVSP